MCWKRNENDPVLKQQDGEVVQTFEFFAIPSYNDRAHIQGLYSLFNHYDNQIKKPDMKLPHKNDFKSRALGVG